MRARRTARLGSVIVVLGAAVVGGCGGSKSASTASGHAAVVPPAVSSEQSAERASIAIDTKARSSSGEIATRFTCRGANESIPLVWAGVGATAKEVVVLVRSLGAEPNGLAGANVDWIVAGISPSVQTIAAGKAPAGAIVGTNSFGQQGYHLCPAQGVPRTIVTINVLAYPKKLNLKPGFQLKEIGAQVKSGEVEWGSQLGYIV
jgi:phosphatidylethanolamine-binding protein (PEBP) family uncharacterized protein